MTFRWLIKMSNLHQNNEVRMDVISNLILIFLIKYVTVLAD